MMFTNVLAMLTAPFALALVLPAEVVVLQDLVNNNNNNNNNMNSYGNIYKH